MISFIIVSYNSGQTIFSTIDSILNSGLENFEIIVVDNNSPNKEYLTSLRESKAILLVESKENLGFSKANNLGVSKCVGETLVFVNPDVYFNGDSIANLLAHSRSNVVVSSRLYGESGSVNKSIYMIPFVSNYIKSVFGFKPIYWVHGALLIFTKEDFLKVGLWSEEYFMYSEDADICLKIHLNGLSLNILDENVVHVGGTSTSTTWSSLERAVIIQKSSYVFYSKYKKKFDYYLINFAVIFKMALFRDPNLLIKVKATIKSLK